MGPLSRVIATELLSSNQVGFAMRRSLFSRPTSQVTPLAFSRNQVLFRGHEHLFRPHINSTITQIPLSNINFRSIQARAYSVNDDSLSKIQEKLWDTRTPQEIAVALDLGADINAQDTRALDPTHNWIDDVFNLALAILFPPVLLLSYISRIKVSGLTPLMYAAKRNNVECLKTLIDRGANLNLQDNRGRTAIMIAASYDNKEAAQLLANSADLNLQNKQGETALMLAAEGNNFEITQILLDHRADKTIKDASGKTASDLAEKNGHIVLAKFIEMHGV